MRINLKRLKRTAFQEKLNRLKKGYPLTFKRTKPRDPEKEKALLEFLLRTTPSAEDILSGKAFRRFFRK